MYLLPSLSVLSYILLLGIGCQQQNQVWCLGIPIKITQFISAAGHQQNNNAG